ncbi:unnamed protein product [Caenorhabditis brenneri]
MPTNASISYPNLQFIVQYLEANKRIELARRCPSIKTVDKLVPLQLENFAMSDDVLNINETYYQLEVIQKFTDGRRFSHTDKRNGSLPEDLEEYGYSVASTNHILTPGDIEIPPIEHDENVINMEENLENLEKTLPCEMYILLTIHLPDDSKKFEAVKYDKQLYQAMKYLTTQIFGGRDCVVNVKHFDLFFPTTHFGYVFRLPESLKFKISSLEISNNVERVVNGLRPILDPKSFPLEEIKVIVTEDSYSTPRDPRTKFQNVWNHKHLAVESAKSLYLVAKDCFDCFEFVLSARNPRIRFDDARLSQSELLDLINKILEEDWRQNIFYTFGIDEKSFLYKAVEDLVETHDTWIEIDDEEGEKCFIRIHINDVRDLCIKFEPIPGAVANFYDNDPRWLLEIYTGKRKDDGFLKSTLENLYDEIETSFSKS